MKKLYGVTTAMITPFDGRGRVDLEAVERLTDFLIERGVHCLYPCGTTGEMLLMSAEERKAAARAVVRRAAGRAVVYVHAGAMRPEETIDLARHACEIGADGVGVVTPIFFSAHQEAMVAYYRQISRALPDDFPLYLYNIPQCSGNDLTVDAARRIVESCKNVVGIKYSRPDLVRTGEYLQVAEDFEVVQGADGLFLPSLAMGCAGTVSGVSSVYPEPFVEVYRAFRAGDLALSRRAQRLACAFVAALRAGSNMAYFKAGLRRRGLEAGHVRSPQLDLTSAQCAALGEELRALEDGCPQGLLRPIV